MTELGIGAGQRNEQRDLGRPGLGYRRRPPRRPGRHQRRYAPIGWLPDSERRRYHRRRASGERAKGEDDTG